MDDVYDLVVIGVMSRSLPPRVVTGATPRRERRSSPIAASISTRERSAIETSEGGMIVKADDTQLKEGGYSCDSLLT